jgi:cysteine-rich repeat protein
MMMLSKIQVRGVLEMKFNKLSLFLSIFVAFLSLSFVQAYYLQLDLREQINQDSGNVEVSVLSINSVDGDYNFFVAESENLSQIYRLDLIGSLGEVIDSFYFDSSLIDSGLNGPNSAEVEILFNSTNSVVLPYSSGVEKGVLFFNNLPKLEIDFSSISRPICKLEGETGSYGQEGCCEGLSQIIVNPDQNVFSCIKTNDGICDSLETQYNSFFDCFNISSYSCKSDFVKNMFGGCTALVNATCGNDIIEPVNFEQCDDGNNISGDGCSSNCKFESTGSCSKQIGFVLFNNNSYQNTCDGNKLITYSCRFNLFTFNILRMFKYSLNQNVRTCEFSCLADRCITQEEFNQLNNHTVPSLPPTGLDLPPEPEKPLPL